MILIKYFAGGIADLQPHGADPDPADREQRDDRPQADRSQR